MTFRIDAVNPSPFPEAAWGFSIKGHEGRGQYVVLYTDANGDGLFLPEMSRPMTFHSVISREGFHVSVDTTPVEAGFELARALIRLGWGPMVNQNGEITEVL